MLTERYAIVVDIILVYLVPARVLEMKVEAAHLEGSLQRYVGVVLLDLDGTLHAWIALATGTALAVVRLPLRDIPRGIVTAPFPAGCRGLGRLGRRWPLQGIVGDCNIGTCRDYAHR